MNTAARIAVLGKLSKRWLDLKFPYRRKAVRRFVQKSGFAPAAAEAMLDSLFEELTEAKLKLLVRVEAGNSKKLDAARGPKRITHVLSGNVPNPGVQSVIHGLLVRAENVVKPSSRDEGIFDLYLSSLRAVSPKLAASCRMLKPADRIGLRRAIGASDRVIAYGSDESVEAVRKMAGPKKKFTGYGHRVSFSLITRKAMTRSVAQRTALDVWMMDKRGCLSPSVIFIEESAAEGAFVADLLMRLGRFEKSEGRALPDLARAASIRREEHEAKLAGDFFRATPKRRYFARVSRTLGAGWSAAPGAVIRRFRRIGDVYRFLSPYEAVLQAAALECAPSESGTIEKKLGKLGFNRICRAGMLQFPPASWPHDGRPNFADWLTAGKIRG